MTTDMQSVAFKTVNKIAGIKVQAGGGLTRTDDIYDVQIAEFIVEVDRDFLAQMANSEAADLLEEGADSCKVQLSSQGLKVMGMHMRSKPKAAEPHIIVKVLADDVFAEAAKTIDTVTVQSGALLQGGDE